VSPGGDGVPRKVLVTQGRSRFDLIEAPAENEHHLQEVMKNSPTLLPVDDLGISGPLLVVGREASVASGSIDLVGVVPSGDVVLVEFKTGPQNPDFRHALAQLIDYGSDLWE
jgi:RecB family endonuclease NucS